MGNEELLSAMPEKYYPLQQKQQATEELEKWAVFSPNAASIGQGGAYEVLELRPRVPPYAGR